jgi:cytochrome P450
MSGSIFDMDSIDLYSVESFSSGHPHDLYAWLRENDPVHRHEEPDGPGFWAVTRWEDIRRVNRDDEHFSHWPVSMIEDFMETPHKSMVNLDGSLHAQVRRVAAPVFMPGAVRKRMDRFTDAAETIIEEIRPRGGCDLAVDVAGKMASYITADVLRIPRSDAIQLYEHVEVGLGGGGAYTIEDRKAASDALIAYGAEMYEERRANPGDDVCSRLAACEINGESMSLEDFSAHMTLLIVGAGDTTRHLIGGGMQALFDFPDQRELLVNNFEAYLPGAIEEMLRWVTPVVYNRRTVIKETELRGKILQVGDKVCVYYGAGNRDPEVFMEPNRFDIARSPNTHLSFSGQGRHFCLGAHVARAEANAMVSSLFQAFPDIRPDGPMEWTKSNFVMGPAHLPVIW